MHTVYLLLVKVTVTVPTVTETPQHAFTPVPTDIMRLRLKCDGTSEETRFRL